LRAGDHAGDQSGEKVCPSSEKSLHQTSEKPDETSKKTTKKRYISSVEHFVQIHFVVGGPNALEVLRNVKGFQLRYTGE